MRLVSFLATFYATLADASALASTAPFTPAIVFFVAYSPLAAIFAGQHRTVPALVVVAATVVAWFLSPLRIHELHRAAPMLWIGSVVVWAVIAIYLSARKRNPRIRRPTRGELRSLRKFTVERRREGALETELEDGRIFTPTPGMSYQVADAAEAHKSRTMTGAKLFIVDRSMFFPSLTPSINLNVVE